LSLPCCLFPATCHFQPICIFLFYLFSHFWIWCFFFVSILFFKFYFLFEWTYINNTRGFHWYNSVHAYNVLWTSSPLTYISISPPPSIPFFVVCLSLPTAGITDVCHHAWLNKMVLLLFFSLIPHHSCHPQHTHFLYLSFQYICVVL
jgi:hypothetical protein